FLFKFNDEHPDDTYEPYQESDLNKIAIWSATGSGKTILMQINYFQYLHYCGGKLPDDASFILLTPREGLSLQHGEEYSASNISAGIYNKSVGRWMLRSNEISILENTKLGDKDQEKTVSVKRFGNRNVVFVDEGHRGSSSGTDGAWQKYRDELCSEGFSFEYSATFGQAIAASTDESLSERYGKCIIFDYSYRHFYGDGYGKDYNILNLPEDCRDGRRALYLTACLLTYYEQKKLYLDKEKEFNPYNIENPLFVFVGASVNAVRTQAGKRISDVVDILLFFKDFITDTKRSKSRIKLLRSRRSSMLDQEGNDIFRTAFPYLVKFDLPEEAIYEDVLKTVFNCANVGATFHIEKLRGISGEIQLRLGNNEPFGVINVGDDSALLKLCGEHGFTTDTIDFSDSLFRGITKPDSTINLLIGSKKFTEGWNCWRVSTMGLMNVGQGEGSEIIQLFGRGVRLKGYEMSLKRSSFYKEGYLKMHAPEHINILETLNIFGIRANYMKQFKEYLDKEGVSTKKKAPLVLEMPVIRKEGYEKLGLYSLRVKDGEDFKKVGPRRVFQYSKDIPKVTLDCYSSVQFLSSFAYKGVAIRKTERLLERKHLDFLDYEIIFSELQRYKVGKRRYNIIISQKNIKNILLLNKWYTLLIPEDELKIQSFKDYERFEKIVIALLKKYLDKFYYTEQNKWESDIVGYELVPMDDKNENFLNEEKDKYSITIEETDENKSTIGWLRDVINKIKNIIKETEFPKFSEKPLGDIEVIITPIHLYNPLLHLRDWSEMLDIYPVELNNSEINFVKKLCDHIKNENTSFQNKEIYLIRNRSRRGVGFFESAGFYPDFILWILTGGKQYITFIDPHSMKWETNSDKVGLYEKLKTVIAPKLGEENIVLNSFILSPTRHDNLPGQTSPEEWKKNHVLFMSESNYIEDLIAGILENENSRC
ncbi:MAG: restriction endonuclease subunit R, partial [Clostridia bacterium]|nr:restriction endonuclease subunit R [Clostridia bacterium]